MNDGRDVAYSKKRIAARLDEITEPISAWVKHIKHRTGKDVMLLEVLHGGSMLAEKLQQRLAARGVTLIKGSVTVGYSVPGEAGRLEILELVPEFLEQETVLLVTDIADADGRLDELDRLLRSRGTREVAAAVVIKRVSELRPQCHYLFDHPVEWPERQNDSFAGFGFSSENDPPNWRWDEKIVFCGQLRLADKTV